MKTVLAHLPLRVDDYATGQQFAWVPNQWHSVRDEFADEIARVHPDKLCILEDGEYPEQHKCKLGRNIALQEGRRRKYETEMEEEPEETTMMMSGGRVSAQRRLLRRQAKHRSRRARIGA